MHRRSIALLLSLLFTACLFAGPAAADDAKPQDKAKAEAPAEKPAEKPVHSVTKHKIRIGNADLDYTATAEDVILKDGEGKPTADFFTISYTKDGVAHPEDRPLTFVFNGGPGSSSIWLHLGLVGPRIIDIPSDASDPGAPPYRMRDNPATILRATDVVFVDPVGTGFSHAMGEKKDADFWGYEEDADSVAEFIRTFITMHNRWNSPKYLLGESYGGIRIGMLVPRLQQKLNIGLNGVIMISAALNMGTLPFDVAGNDLPYATHLPALAATAYYHHKLPGQWASQDALLNEVEKFAGPEYLEALFQGDRLDPKERDRVAEKLHEYTGLSKDYILKADLRIYALRFTNELLRDEGKSVGLLDGRYTQEETDHLAEFPDSDPFDAKTGSIYVALFQNYLRNDLGVDLVRHFLPQNGEANQKWKRPADGQNAFAGFVDVTGALAQGTKDNGALRIFDASGYHDLTVSYFAERYMLTHSGIDPKRMTIDVYPGGHMMYLYRPSEEKLSNDVVSFIDAGAK